MFARHPVDLGTRCTVFMNSNVKQAQKEGAAVSDISAGLAYSVIKNALLQGHQAAPTPGSWASTSWCRAAPSTTRRCCAAFERIAGAEAVCPDISGLMGAFGAALIARDRYHGQPDRDAATLPDIAALTYTAKTARCGGCENNCLLTVNTFSDGGRYISGNRCERAGGKPQRRPAGRPI